MSPAAIDTNHGTYSRYRKLMCRCLPCQAVSRAKSAGYDSVTGGLLVECWCGVDLVVVSKNDVYEGRTRSCGRNYCEERAA